MQYTQKTILNFIPKSSQIIPYQIIQIIFKSDPNHSNIIKIPISQQK